VEIVRNIALVLHFIGLASIIGSFLVQAKAPTKRVDPAMLHGALTQLVTGLVLVGLVEANADGADLGSFHAKIAVKTVVLLVIGFLAFRKRAAQSISIGEWGAIGGLTVLNVVIAVFW
jgi:hypothetical protein